MKSLISDLSQRQAALVARMLYPIWFVVGYFGLQYVPTTLVVAGDATGTASRIINNEMLFRVGIVGGLLEPLIFVIAALALYQLLRPVSRNHASLMLVFVVLSVPITMVSALGRVGALLALNGADYLRVFGVYQLRALAMLFLDLGAQGIVIATIFWGLWLFPLGYLVYKSGYFPRVIGVLVVIAGFGFLLSPFTYLLLPNYAATLIPISDVLTLGEAVFVAWFLVKGARLPEAEEKGA